MPHGGKGSTRTISPGLCVAEREKEKTQSKESFVARAHGDDRENQEKHTMRAQKKKT